MIGRLVRSTDFENVLRVPARARSVHFAVHHLQAPPAPVGRSPHKGQAPKLSTGTGQLGSQAVDDSGGANTRLWLGTVVPKRHARRSVTRSMLKRQMRASVQQHAGELSAGMWVIRLRAPFAREVFPSTASESLRDAAADELAVLMRRAVQAGGTP